MTLTLYKTAKMVFMVLPVFWSCFATASTIKEADNLFQNGRYEEATKIYRQLASTGSHEAQFNLGYIFLDGYGVEPNIEKALYWYRKSADQGYAPAQFNAAKILLGDVQNIPSNQLSALDGLYDFVTAVTLLSSAAQQGHGEALNSLGFLMLQDAMWPTGYPSELRTPEIACNLIELSIEADPKNLEAHNNLGTCYGVFLEEKDVSRAIQHHKIAAEGGLVEAMSNLGGHMVTSGFTTNDIKKKVEGLMWLKVSAKLGNAGAQSNLGILDSYVDRYEDTLSTGLADKCISSDFKDCFWR